VNRSSNTFKSLDWGTILLYAILVGFGWINIYAAVYNEEHSSILDVSQRYGKQLLWISVSLVLIIIIFHNR
jgi:rod shape determining protein RodA